MTYEKNQLAEELNDVTNQIVALANSLSEKDLSKTVYAGGWNAFQIFAHLASFDYARLLKGWLRQAHAETQPAPSAFDSEAWNQQQVAARMGKSIKEIIDEVVAHRTATVEVLNNATQEELDTPIRTRAGMSGTVGQILRAMAIEHEEEHLADVRRALGEELRK